MDRRRLLGGAGAALFMGTRPAHAAVTYYVSPAGNDFGPGTASQPFRSMSHACAVVRPGDTVVVGDGVYEEAPLLLTSGTSTAPIVLRAQNRWRARIVANKPIGYTLSINASYVTAIGFDVVNISDAGGGISVYRSVGVSILGCRVRNCGGNGIGVAYSDDTIISGNRVFGNATRATQLSNSGISVWQSQPMVAATFGVLISGNIVYGNYTPANSKSPTDGNGIIVDTPMASYTRPIVVENNICYRNGGKGILVLLANSAIVRFNTCYLNGQSSYLYGNRAEIENAKSGNSVFVNNICYGTGITGTYGVADTLSTGGVWLNNCVFNGRLGPGLSASAFLLADPHLVDPANARFGLAGGSPCVGAATDAYGHPATDYAGRPRGARLDIGAYQLRG